MTISKALIKWYQLNARNLPWRNTKDPYLIWVSEIIMQQTRVEQGLGYYLRFVKMFPNIRSFSQASEDQVLKLWQGLGYYSRARNMMFAAQQVMNRFGGVFPSTFDDLLKLKGVGPYTAAAIASFCYNLPYAVVDGNVFRVLARYYGINTPINTHKGQKEFASLAQEILNRKNAATHNQAMMEFGALLCKAKNPNCSQCTLVESCFAFANNKIADLPQKEKKLRIINKYLHFFYISDGHHILIQKRDYTNIWKGLYQLPLIETDKSENTDFVLLLAKKSSIIPEKGFQLVNVQEMSHKLTHRNLQIKFYYIIVEKISSQDFLQIDKARLGDFAFPRPIEKYLESSRKQ